MRRTPRGQGESVSTGRDALTPGDEASLEHLRRVFEEYLLIIQDDALRGEISGWLDRASEATDADSAVKYVEGALNDMLVDYPMYDAPGLTDGAEGFPDKCQGCPRYASACPILGEPYKSERERLLDKEESEERARQVYQKQARETGCVVIPGLLSEWEDQHAPLVREGHDLLDRLAESIHGDNRGGVR